jgi:hypothetical protein
VKEERLGSPNDFAARLASHLAGLTEPGSPLPNDADLTALVEATFFASLYEEEARRVEFSVAWQPGAHDCAAVVAITPPVRATPSNLTKVAPATWHDATSIAVRRQGTDLVAWALLEQNATAHLPLTIRALASGVLRVDYAGVPRALYARGEILFFGGAHVVKSPAQRLTRTFPTWSIGAEPSAGIDPRAAVVTRLAARMLAHRHGGMILVIPSDVATPQGARAHYTIDDGTNLLASRYLDVIRDVAFEHHLARLTGSRPRGVDGRLSVRDEPQIAFAEAIELVARLTAIDNALLIDTDLRLRGFGVQVIEGDAPSTTFEHANPYSDDTHVDDLSTFKGTRHPAGVLFCMRQPTEAAAIIASQDGHLSLATKDTGGVVQVLGSYEHAFGW